MQQKKVLITTAEWKSTYSIMMSLARKGHLVTLLTTDRFVPALSSKYCHDYIEVPKESEREAYLSKIFEIIKGGNYDIIVPISDLCVRYFSENSDEIGQHIKLFLSTKEQIHIASNKKETYRFCLKNNIPIPKTFFPENLNDIYAVQNELTFPCVVKASLGAGGSGNTYIKTKDELVKFFTSIGKYKQKDWPVIQEFIHGTFFGLTAVCHEGKVLDYFLFELIRQYPLSGGVTVYAVSRKDKEAVQISKQLIEKLKWNGVIDLDYFIVKGRGFVLLEVNPRFSGTNHFAYVSGVDLPYKYLRLAFGESVEGETDYQEGLFYRSIFQQEINSCLEDKRHILDFIKNTFRWNVRYDFNLADKKYFFQQLRRTKWALFKNFKKSEIES